MKKAKITKEELLADGWEEVNGDVVLMKKKIENINPLNSDDDDTGIKLIIHRYFNQPQFGILLPDGGILNFNVDSMKELKAFETAIYFYDAPF